MKRRAVGFFGLLVALAACSSKEDGPPVAVGTGGAGGNAGQAATSGGKQGEGTGGKASGGGGAGTGHVVNWAEDIAPLVYRECISCHRDGGIGPFSLTEYELSAALSIGLASMTEAREMPPMPVDNSGSCNTYSNARWLTDAEIALFKAWADADAPEGDPALAPELPPAPDGLTRIDATISASEDYTPNEMLGDDYRCFVVDPGLKSDQFLVAYQVTPGDPREVHHVIAYAPADAAAEAQAVALDTAEAGPGYTCFGSARVDAEPRVLWAPGVDVVTLPAGTGLPLAAGRKLILQIHYNTHSGAFPDRTRVDLRTEPSVGKAAKYQAVADPDMSVAPGQMLGITTKTHQASGQPSVVIYGALPHMHTLGRTLRVDMNSGTASERCLVDVDRWNFHWQNAWWYSTPITVPRLDSFTIRCGYDTTARATPVTWGEGTNDEMCISYLYVTGP